MRDDYPLPFVGKENSGDDGDVFNRDLRARICCGNPDPIVTGKAFDTRQRNQPLRVGEPGNLEMKIRKLLSVSLAILLPLIQATAAETPTAQPGGKAASPSPVHFESINDGVAVPEPPSIALILAGALTFLGWSVLRRRSEL
jgi:hypothetical protein